ncbi:MAG: hypothetical protein WC489_08015, partial [Patescibacteria group bacterium]
DEKAIAEISANYDRQITQFKEGQLDERTDAVESYAEELKSIEEKSGKDVVAEETDTTERVKGLWEGAVSGLSSAWESAVADIKRDSEDWSDVLGSVQGALGDIATGAIHNIGAALVTGEADWASWGIAALKMIADVLDSLMAQLAALAATKLLLGDFGSAALAAAGAVAAGVAAGGLRAWIDEEENAKDETDELTGAIADQNAALEGTGEAFDIVTSSMERYGVVMTKIKEATESFYEGLKDTGTDIAGMLTSGINEGLAKEDFMSGIKDYIMNLVTQGIMFTGSIASKIAEIGEKIRLLIAGGKKEDIEAARAGLAAQVSALWDEASTKAASASALVSSLFEGYAGGTPYSESGYRLVGEQGPEIIDFPQGARVYNNSETKEILKSDSKVLNFTFNSPREVNQYEAMKAASAEARRLAAEGVF